MIRFKKSKKILAAILTAGMLLAGNGVPICAAEPVSVAQTEEQLNYLVVGSPVVCTPGSQFVLADVGDGTEKLSDAVLVISSPKILILPALYFNSERMQLIVVDFPLPFGPSSPRISPCRISNDRSSTAFFCLYSFVRFFTSTTALISLFHSPFYSQQLRYCFYIFQY